MAQFLIEGGHPLRGTVNPRGNKNAVLPIIAATVLTEEQVTLTNVPNITDVHTMLDILEELGASVERNMESHTVVICCKNVSSSHLEVALTQKLRASIFFIGPLLAKFGQVEIGQPGGCQIGQRQIDTHFLVFEKLGARVECGDVIKIIAPKLQSTFVWSDEMSVSATGNFILTCVLLNGQATLYNAASEPHVQDLCDLLVKMGAIIEGAGTNKITITGTNTLHGVHHSIIPDHVEVGSFIAAGVVTHGELIIKNVHVQHYDQILYQFSKLGVHVELKNDDLFLPSDQSLEIKKYSDQHMGKIECLPWPGFPADLLQITLVMATQCNGKILIHDKLFESRLFFVDKLIRMGAEVYFSDPHRAIIFGPKKLKGKFIESPDIRAGMALVVAALAATGISTIDNVQFI